MRGAALVQNRVRPLALATALLVTGGAFLLYHSTMLPGMDLGDTPSFQTMGGSVLVSPRDAYPLYFALAAPFVWWFTANPAHAMNLASTVQAALACGLTVFVALELSGSLAPALIASLVLVGSYTFWSQAVTTEVYALHIMCLALVLLVLWTWEHRPTFGRLLLFFFVYSIGFGNHLTMILALPGLAIFLLLTAPRGARDLLRPRVVVAAVLCAIAGALLYVWNARTMLIDPVPMRSATEAARWFWFDVTKADWRQTMVLEVPRVMVAERLRMFAFDVHQQFGWPALLVAAIGVTTLVRAAPARAWLLLLWLAASAVFALTYSVGDTHVFLLPFHFVVALLIAPGLVWLARHGSKALGPRAPAVVWSVALLFVVVRIHDEYPALDRSHDRRAEEALARLTGDIDDRQAILLADLNWELQNGLNYYTDHTRRDLAVARLPDVLPYAPTLIRDNQSIGRGVLLTERARAALAVAYGPLFTIVEDSRVTAAPLSARLADLAPDARYVFCLIKPTRDASFDRADTDRALARLTGDQLLAVPADDYVVVAGRVGRAPAVVRSSSRPFRHDVVIGDLPVRVRIDMWLPFDTIRRMGFGHVISGRHHSLIVERGVSVVALDAEGRPTRTEYAAGLFEPQPRYRILPP